MGEDIKEKEKKKLSTNTNSFRRISRKAAKVAGYVLLILVGLNLLLCFLITIPSIQNALVSFATGELKTMLKTEVQIKEVRLNILSQATIKGLYIEDLSQDTLLYADHLKAQFDTWKILTRGELKVKGIDLDDFIININQKDSLSDFNFQFIVDAFSSEDSTTVDTTSSGSIQAHIQDIKISRGRFKYDVFADSVTPNEFNTSHISLYDLGANIDARSIDPDKLDIALNSLAAKEGSGLEISSLSGRIFSEGSMLWIEDFVLSLPNSKLATHRLVYHLETEEFELTTKEVEIDGQDLKPFYPDLKFLRSKLTADIDAVGKLPRIDVNKLNLYYGNECVLETSAEISNYDKYDIADILLSIDRFQISKNAITDFARLGDASFEAPGILDSIGDIRFKGKLDGHFNDFKLTADAAINQGIINLTAGGSVDSLLDNINIKAKLKTEDFQLGKLIGESTGMGLFSMHFDVDYTQSPKDDMSAKIYGAIDKLQYEEEFFQNFYFYGSYNPLLANLKLYSNSEEEGKIYVDANLKQTKIPEVDLKFNLDEFNLNRVYQNEDWTDPRLSLRLNVNLNSFDIDQMTGRVTLDSLHLHGKNFNFEPGNFLLTMSDLGNKKKDISLKSQLIAANVNGEFKLSTIYPEISNILHKSMPHIFDKDKSIKEHFQNFTFKLDIFNTEKYSKIFGIPVDLIQPLKLNGRVNTFEEKFELYSSIPKVRVDKGTHVHDTRLGMVQQDSIVKFGFNTHLTTGLSTYGMEYRVNGTHNTLFNEITMHSDSAGLGINGALKANVKFEENETYNRLITRVNFLPTDLQVGKLHLTIDSSSIAGVNNHFRVRDFAIKLNKKDFFGIDGVISYHPTDSLKLYFAHAELGDILKGFDVNNIEARANGEIYLRNLLDKPELNIEDFMVYDIAVNTDTLGTISINSEWSDRVKGVKFDAMLQKKLARIAQFNGYLPSGKDPLDINIFMDRFDVNWLEPYTEGLLTKISGSISSDINISGYPRDPIMKGFLGFNDAVIGIDYTNVTYHLADSIRISPDYMGFKDLKLRDDAGNIARVDASITHTKFRDFKLALDMRLRDFQILNTMHRTDSLFYGKVSASGRVSVRGDKNGMDVNMQVNNGRNSSLNILIPQTSEADDYKSVVYINVPIDPNSEDSIPKDFIPVMQPTLPVKLSIALKLDKEMELGVVIDPVTGDKMNMKGAGNINFTYLMDKNLMTTFGRYELEDGKVNLNLQGVKKIAFSMRKGSTLNFVGDPLKTQFNILAYNRVKADLKTLDYSFESEQQSTKVEVDCDLGIAGNMNKMDLTYGISLPYANDDFKRKISSIINTDEERIKQFASLVATKRFMRTSGSSGSNFTDGIWTDIASNALSSGLNAALGNVLGDKWEVGTNIDSGDSGTDMSVNVSTRLFDDKLRLKTNLGYRTDNSTTTDNSFIGDFEAEYQLNINWMLRGYNVTNERFYRQAPTTQGLGVAYTKDAPTFMKLFQGRRKWNRQKGDRNRNRRQRSDSTAIITDSIRPANIDSLQVDSININMQKADSVKVTLPKSEAVEPKNKAKKQRQKKD